MSAKHVRPVCTAAASQVSPAHVVDCAGNPLVHAMFQNTEQATAATALMTILNQAPQNAGKRELGGCKPIGGRGQGTAGK
jgi:hypothetical protein